MRILLVALRFLMGYLVAIMASAFLFACMFHIFISTNHFFAPSSIIDFLFIAFASAYLGFITGLPFTILASLLFHYLLPKRMSLFLLLGTLCPAGAYLLLFPPNRIENLWEGDGYKILLTLMPPGLVAAYLYGALGFGYGFGRWKFDKS